MGWPVEVRKLLRPAPLVPPTLRLDQLLDLFRKKRTQMAIILDEYGGTEGLVTMEDVLEELVGEIREEHRRDQQQEIVRRDQTSWLVDGAVSVSNLLELVGRPELRAAAPRDVSTVAGLIQTLLGRIAVVADRVTWNDLTLEVVDMDGLRIDRVLVTVPPRSTGSEEA
jgi:putative hemolysin